MIPWKWLIIDGYKSHAVPAYLQEVLMDDLSGRPEASDLAQPLAFEATDITKMAIDMPGMIRMDRPWMTVNIDGLQIEIPCEDFLDFVSQLKRAPERVWRTGGSMYVGASYYKLHGFHKCIVLTPDLKFQMLEQLEDKLQEAEARATAFWADKKLPSQVLREANAKAHGLPDNAYDDQNFGANKQDRFHDVLKGKKGEA